MKPTLKELKPLLPYFSKYCTNRYEATLPNGKMQSYLREDLHQWSKEAYERGDRYFYVEPVSPNLPNGKLRLSKPKYIYSFSVTLTDDELMKPES